ncbi:MAG: GNAT family N-acetyltransferase [Flavobacteriales bacterium]
MITLTPITEPAKLEEYFKFRYDLYKYSRIKGFVAKAEDTDKDAFDDHAQHYGWYVDGKLAGCIRFIEPDETDHSIPLLSYMSDPEASAAVRSYIAERKRKGQSMIEASRFCLAPEYRGLRNARDFVSAMVATMQPLGYEHGIFDCRAEQAPFYRLCGFEQIGPSHGYYTQLLEQYLTFFQYDFRTLVGHNKELMERMKQKVRERKAA